MPNQMHGISFENCIKAANHIFDYAAADRVKGPTDIFDIDADLDIMHGFPTSIKATGSNSIALSDARRFWNSLDLAPYRILVGYYRQIEEKKVFHQIDEYIIRPEHRYALLGSIDEDDISFFHNSLQFFGEGQHKEARLWAKEKNIEYEGVLGAVKLNPKIDSKKQRRLQCSVNSNILEFICGVTNYTENFGNLILPLTILSTRRY